MVRDITCLLPDLSLVLRILPRRPQEHQPKVERTPLYSSRLAYEKR